MYEFLVDCIQLAVKKKKALNVQPLIYPLSPSLKIEAL